MGTDTLMRMNRKLPSIYYSSADRCGETGKEEGEHSLLGALFLQYQDMYLILYFSKSFEEEEERRRRIGSLYRGIQKKERKEGK